MKKIIYGFIVPILSFCLVFAACEDWSEMEPAHKENMKGTIFTEDYYEALRAYKASDHSVAFGWFGNWTGNGASLDKSLAGLPDSVDFVSIWGNWKNISESQQKDLRYVQQVKGTKALMCFIVQNIGDQLTPKDYAGNYLDFWGWNEDKGEAIKKYANAICDTIDKYGYDGFDIDYEPNFGHSGNMGGNHENMMLFIQEMGKRIGPKSGTGRLFVIDGEPQSIVPESGSYFNYFIVQAYDCAGDALGTNSLDNRLKLTIDNFDGHLTPEEVAKKYIVTENFEKWAQSGGANFTDRYGNNMKSLEGMARWTPIINGKKCVKGGVGTYHMEYEFALDGREGTYPFMRNAIRIMNPPMK